MVLQKKIMKKFNYIILLLFLFAGCSSLGEAKKVLKNEKTSSTDEFFVKKKEPLVLPPDFDKLPLPKSNQNQSLNSQEKNKIKKILNAERNNSEEIKSSSSLEEFIIEKIR